MKIKIKQGCFLAALALFSGGPVFAAGSTLIETPWELGFSVGGVLPEDLRGVSPAPLGRVSVGLPLRPGAYLEANMFGFKASGEAGNPDEKTLGGGLDLRLQRLGDERLQYHLLFGGGYARSKIGTSRVNAPYVNIGWGLGYELAPALELRLDLRGLIRLDDNFIPGRGVTYDATSSVGLVYRLGRQPKTYQPREEPAAAQLPSVPVETAIAAPPLPLPELAPPRVVRRVSTGEDSCSSPPAKALVDASGCLLPQRLQLPRVTLFSGLAADISPDGEAMLSTLAVSLIKNPELFAEIGVHTDTVGDADQNLEATQAQASAVSRYLFELGVPDNRLTASGFGEERPVASEDSAAEIEKNRRIVINLVRR